MTKTCPACKKPFRATTAQKFCRRKRCLAKRKRESSAKYRSTTKKPESNQLLKQQLAQIESKNRPLQGEPALVKLRNLSEDKLVREVNRMLRH